MTILFRLLTWLGFSCLMMLLSGRRLRLRLGLLVLLVPILPVLLWWIVTILTVCLFRQCQHLARAG
jgi:hypothetical protein